MKKKKKFKPFASRNRRGRCPSGDQDIMRDSATSLKEGEAVMELACDSIDGTTKWLLQAALASQTCFESERKKILVGMLRQRSEKTLLESVDFDEDPFESSVYEQWFACKSVQGLREYMEDEYAAEPAGIFAEDSTRKKNTNASINVQGELGKSSDPDGASISLFGVYDGHGGDIASKFCKEVMFGLIREHPMFPVDMKKVLTDSFRTVDKIICQTSCEMDDEIQDGSTSTVAVVDHKSRKIWVACVGDSRCVIVRKDGVVKALSRDHSCTLRDEARRIKGLGGEIITLDGIKRVQGILAVSRAIGDASLKPYVSSVPEVKCFDIGTSDYVYLCIASDGVWDEVSNTDVGSTMLRKGLKDGVEAIVDLADSRGSTDNITFLAIDLSVGESSTASDNCVNSESQSNQYKDKANEKHRKRQRTKSS